MTKHLLLRYLDVRETPLGRVPEGEALHAGLCAAAPRFYGHLAADAAAHVTHRQAALLRLLDGAADATLLAERFRSLPAAEALRTLEVLPERRINRHRARTLALSVMLNHAGLAELAATRRQRLVRLLKHLVGERTWSAVRRALRPGANGASERLLARTFWGHVASERAPAVREALSVLADVALAPGEEVLRKRLAARADLEAGAGLPRETLFGLRGTFHPNTPASRVRYLAPAVTAYRADGPLTEQYKAAWAEGTEAVVGLAPLPATRAPLPGRLAVVLDLSASMALSGERAFHPAALGLALARRLEAEVVEVTLHQVGGSGLVSEGELPRPEGGTDLARALLEAARTDADVILIITDGYENGRTGDTADVAEGLLRLRPGRPIFQVVPRFTPAEDLSSRRLGGPVPLLPVDREDAAGELLARVVLAHAGDVLTDAELDQVQTLLFAR